MKLFFPILNSIAWLLPKVGSFLDDLITAMNPSSDDAASRTVFSTKVSHYLRIMDPLLEELSGSKSGELGLGGYLTLESFSKMKSVEKRLLIILLNKVDYLLINLTSISNIDSKSIFGNLEQVIKGVFQVSLENKNGMIIDPLISYRSANNASIESLLIDALDCLKLLDPDYEYLGSLCIRTSELDTISTDMDNLEYDNYRHDLMLGVESVKIVRKNRYNTSLIIDPGPLSLSILEIIEVSGAESLIDYLSSNNCRYTSMYYSKIDQRRKIRLILGDKLHKLVQVINIIRLKERNSEVFDSRWNSILDESSLLNILHILSSDRRNSRIIMNYIEGIISIMIIASFIKSRLKIEENLAITNASKSIRLLGRFPIIRPEMSKLTIINRIPNFRRTEDKVSICRFPGGLKEDRSFKFPSIRGPDV